jgi:hypothetical protein
MPLGGTWSSVDPPQRAGLFVNVDTVPATAPVADSSGVMGLVVTADWGPANTIVNISGASEAAAFYGSGSDAEFAIISALRGEGLPGRGGASTVRVYRAAASSAAKASASLSNTADPATVAITLTALYEGTRGNNFTVTVQTNAADAARKDILVFEGTTLRESYTSLDPAEISAIVSVINGQSVLLTAAAGVTTSPLANVSNSAFSGGASGASLTSTEHSVAQAAFEAATTFTAFAVHGLTDSTILGTYSGWAERLNSEGKTFVMVVGGGLGEATTAAISRTTSLDSAYVLNIYGDITIDGIEYKSADIASRVAGMVASAGAFRSVSFSQIPEASMDSSPTNAQIETLVRGSVVPFFFDGTTVRLQRARTTLRTTSVTKPEKFKSLLFVRKVQETLRGLDAVALSILGNAGAINTAAGRASILAMFRAKLEELIQRGIALPGGNVYYDASYNNTGESLYIVFAIDMAPGVEQILGRIAIPA